MPVLNLSQMSGNPEHSLRCLPSCFLLIEYFPNIIMQYVLVDSLQKNNRTYLLLGLYHASVNQNELYHRICENIECNKLKAWLSLAIQAQAQA